MRGISLIGIVGTSFKGILVPCGRFTLVGGVVANIGIANIAIRASNSRFRFIRVFLFCYMQENIYLCETFDAAKVVEIDKISKLNTYPPC